MVKIKEASRRRNLMVSLFQIIDSLNLSSVELKELARFINVQACHAEETEEAERS